jgi:4-hydroxy-tetrahydrodipicolinate synthase
MAHGILVATLTPFTDTGIDWPAFERLLAYQLEGGVHGIVIGGTTGEAPALTLQEYRQLIEQAAKIIQGRVPLIAGAGHNSTAYAMELAQQAEAAGADAVLVVNPYYNKPTQDGLYYHFLSIHDAIRLPLIIYNSPSRCAGEISLSTIERLTALPRVIGIKETSGLERYSEMRRRLGHEFAQFTGNDDEILAVLALGGAGCISVTANIAPRLCVEVYEAWQRGDHAHALACHERLYPLHQAMFYESNPIPVKYAAFRLGLCQNNMRLPLTPLSAGMTEKLDQILTQVLEIDDVH